jgi:HAE1 family hydrophobic/amphiphilic exporter-1
VLAAVFVPTAFIPGITGQFYQQFALTVAVSTVISAFNSLTLSPALAVILLKPHSHATPRNPIARMGSFAATRFNRGFDRMSDGYARLVGGLVRRKLLVLPIYLGLVAGTVWVVNAVPRGFIPTLDQGYAIVVVQLPDGSSLSRTDAVVQRASQIMRETPGVQDAVAFAGFSGATFTNASNAAAIFARFRPFDERIASGQSADKIIGDLFGRLQAVEEAFIIAIPPPPVRGLGNAGGFRLQLQERTGDDIDRVLAATVQLMGRARENPERHRRLHHVLGQLAPVYLEIDREKARILNVPISAIFETLQVNLGTAYVNDFNFLGRVWQVRAQADQQFRVEQADINRLRVRSSTGALVPLGTLLEMREVTGPDLIQRFNMYTSVPLQGNAAPGVSSGVALDTMERLAREVLPQGVGFEWTELAYQERQTGDTAVFIFALSVLFVFLVLAAQYESWTLPLAIILIVPMAVLSALLGVMLRGLDNNILTQIGLVVLVGLAAKNAILIVEFAKQHEEEFGDGPDPGGGRGQPPASAPDPHDGLRLHPRRRAPRDRHGPRRGDAPGARHRRVLRHDRRDAVRVAAHPRVLRGDPLPRSVGGKAQEAGRRGTRAAQERSGGSRAHTRARRVAAAGSLAGSNETGRRLLGARPAARSVAGSHRRLPSRLARFVCSLCPRFPGVQR